MSKMLNTKEVAAIFGVTPRGVRKMAEHGAFKTAVKFGRDWRIDPDEVAHAKKHGISYPKEAA